MPRTKNPFDAHIGSRLRLRRTLAGMSQTELGEKIGLTFQQIQKYEKGFNRIGSGRLFQFAEVLGVPPSFFFDGLGETGDDALPLSTGAADHRPTLSRESMELLRAFSNIPDDNIRRRILSLVRALAPAPTGAEPVEAETEDPAKPV